MTKMTTQSGKHFDLETVKPELIDIEDIAHGLTFLCRANGHTRFFYSVAQYSIGCAREAICRDHNQVVVLACLLHDASEAYMADISRPLKQHLSQYLQWEEKLQSTIYQHFLGRLLTEGEYGQVKDIDNQMLSLEFQQLMPEAKDQDYQLLLRDHTCQVEPFDYVKAEFLALFSEYCL